MWLILKGLRSLATLPTSGLWSQYVNRFKKPKRMSAHQGDSGRIVHYECSGTFTLSKPLVLSAMLAALVASPAFAGDWLVFRNGDTRTNEYWSGGAPPVAGQTVPAGSVVKTWTFNNGDKTALNYKLENDSVVYDPPVVEAPTPDPNAPDVNGFVAAIFNAEIWDQVEALRPLRPQLCSMKSSIQENLNTPGVIHKSWEDMKLAPLPEPIVQLVESLAVQYHIPLCPEE